MFKGKNTSKRAPQHAGTQQSTLRMLQASHEEPLAAVGAASLSLGTPLAVSIQKKLTTRANYSSSTRIARGGN